MQRLLEHSVDAAPDTMMSNIGQVETCADRVEQAADVATLQAVKVAVRDPGLPESIQHLASPVLAGLSPLACHVR